MQYNIYKIYKKSMRPRNMFRYGCMVGKNGIIITSVVIMRHDAVGLMVTSPVIKPTSPNSSKSSLYF